MMIPAMGGGSLLPWNKGTFANASPRYIWDASGKVLYGQFAGGTAAIATIDGKRRVQIEGARTNLCNVASAWTLRGGTAVVQTSGQADPGGGTTATKFENVAVANIDDIKSALIIATVDASQALSFFIKPITTTGIITLQNRAGPAFGEWFIDLSLISDWDRATSDHPAVTVNTPFVADSSGQVGVKMFLASGSADFYLWWPQLEDAVFPSSPIAPTVTRAADSLQFAASAIPAAFTSGKWTVDVTTMFAHGDLANSESHEVFYIDASNHLQIDKTGGGDARVRLVAGGAPISVVNVQYSRDQTLTLTVDFPAGELTLSGFTVGDGTYSGAITGGWPSATLHVGTNGLNVAHLYGRISELVAV